jgi:hypothetical protein
MAILTAAFAALALFTPALHGLAIETRQDDGFHWVNTWTSMPQLVEASNMPPAPFVRFPSPIHTKSPIIHVQKLTSLFTDLNHLRPQKLHSPPNTPHVRRRLTPQNNNLKHLWNV